MDRMSRRMFALFAAVFLALTACTHGGGADIGHPVDGVVLLEQVSGSQVGDRLTVTGLSGKQGEIDIPAPALGLTTRVPGKAVYSTGSGAIYLVDAERRSARRLDVPADAGVIFNPILFGQSDRFLVLGSPRGNAGYLLDVRSGSTANLIGLAGAKQLFSSEFSPDGRYLAFFGDELVLVPTGDPSAAVRLGAGHATGFAGFSADSRRVAFLEITDPTHPKLVVQAVAGSDRTSVDLPAGTVRAHILGSGNRAVLQEPHRLSLLTVDQGRTSQLVPFRGTPRLSWFGPDGDTMLFGVQGGSRVLWDWIDLRAGSAHRLGDLSGLQPLLSSPSDRFVFFANGHVPGTVRSLRVLNMANGQTREVLDLGRGSVVPGYQIASEGRFALIPVERGKGGDLRLVPAQEGRSRVVASSSRGLPLGTFSPSGDWVAVSKPPRSGQPPTVSALSTSGSERHQLGQGVRPVWLRG
jgi:hypothetical protein